MERETYVARISEIRAQLRELLQGCKSPQIETMLRNADMELHWALWNLGVVVPLRPEDDYQRSAQPSGKR
jgi:hypothetical protein